MPYRLELKVVIEPLFEAEIDHDTLEEALEMIDWLLPYCAAIVIMGWEYKGDYKWEIEGNGTEIRVYEV